MSFFVWKFFSESFCTETVCKWQTLSKLIQIQRRNWAIESFFDPLSPISWMYLGSGTSSSNSFNELVLRLELMIVLFFKFIFIYLIIYLFLLISCSQISILIFCLRFLTKARPRDTLENALEMGQKMILA